MTDHESDTSPTRPAGLWEYGVATTLLLLGLYVAYSGQQIGVGTPRRMGPGFLPMAVGVSLAALSLGIFWELSRLGGRSAMDVPLRPLVLIPLSMAVFAATVGPLGLIPATVLLVLIGAFADATMTAKRAALTAVALSVIGYLLFIRGWPAAFGFLRHSHVF